MAGEVGRALLQRKLHEYEIGTDARVGRDMVFTLGLLKKDSQSGVCSSNAVIIEVTTSLRYMYLGSCSTVVVPVTVPIF